MKKQKQMTLRTGFAIIGFKLGLPLVREVDILAKELKALGMYYNRPA